MAWLMANQHPSAHHLITQVWFHLRRFSGALRARTVLQLLYIHTAEEDVALFFHFRPPFAS